MSYKIISALPSSKLDCVVLGLDKKNNLSALGKSLDEMLGGHLSAVIKQESPEAKPGTTLLVSLPGNDKIKRVLLVANGEKETTAKTTLKTLEGVAAALKNLSATKVCVVLESIQSGDQTTPWVTEKLVQAIEAQTYTFNEFKSGDKKPVKEKDWQFVVAADEKKSAELAMKRGVATVQGIALTKNLGNLPGNVCTPTYLAKQAKELGKKYSHIKTSVLDEKEMKALGMGSLLSVSAGSDEPAKLIVMEYQGGKAKEKPHVLVGKGITFDSGGISLKPGEAMDEMKYDMCGAATVFGVMQTIAELQPAINVIGVVAAAENMPSGKATKPGDIVTTMSGKTVEILNTDAEGRLVLCDALTYVEKFKPASVVDIATLTGACIIALGNHTSGLLSNNDALADELLNAGQKTLDRAWRLPLFDEYQEQLDSNFADMQNIGGRAAGTITAACFLSRFTESYPWAHLDIAGTAWVSGKQKGATGRPVSLLVEYLLNK